MKKHIWEGAVGRVHPQTAELALLRADALLALGRVDEALAQAREGLAIFEQILPADHPSIAQARELIARIEAVPDDDGGGVEAPPTPR